MILLQEETGNGDRAAAVQLVLDDLATEVADAGYETKSAAYDAFLEFLVTAGLVKESSRIAYHIIWKFPPDNYAGPRPGPKKWWGYYAIVKNE